MATLWGDRRGAYLLMPLLLSIYPLASKSNLTKNVEDFENENTTRPELIIPQGKLRGVNMVTHHGRNIFGFKGIPFAQPPVGNLRFKGPVPAGNWNGTLDASNDFHPCPQNRFLDNPGSENEDCLYLNVYTPWLPTTKNLTLLPVMLYVHGGAFKAGQNSAVSFGPYFILDKDVILVVPNYRLGLLGFLSTGDEVSPGNYGLKDLVQAMEWNRDNIQYFGGDPNRVTIFGQSAGAMSVQLMTISNQTNGLFQRYITDSGSALAYDAQRTGQVLANRSIQLGEYLGCPTTTSIALVTCLRGFNVSQLVGTESLFDVWNGYPTVVWGPNIEPDIDGAFLTDRPTNLFAAGKARNLPWLSSVNRNEGLLYAIRFYNRPDLFEDFLDKIDIALPVMLAYNTLVDNVTAYTVALKSYYLNDLTANRTLLLNNLTQLIGDALFVYSTYSANQQQLIHAESSQFLCSFEYRGTFSFSYLFSGGSVEDHGVSHSDELLYLFPQSYSRLGPPGTKMNEADWNMVETMVQLWTSFAINGKPSTLDPNNTTIWEPYSSRKNYLRIGNNSDTSIGVEYNFMKNRMQFWDELTAATTWK